MNSFDQLIDEAKKNNLCTKAFCTTCGAREYVTTISETNTTNPGFTQDLQQCDFNNLTQLNDWTGALVRVLRHSSHKYCNDVFMYWLEREDISARLYDYLFFYVVRHYGNRDSIDKWIVELTQLSAKYEDISIVESLLIHIKYRVRLYPDLVELVQSRYTNNPGIMRLYKFR